MQRETVVPPSPAVMPPPAAESVAAFPLPGFDNLWHYKAVWLYRECKRLQAALAVEQRRAALFAPHELQLPSADLRTLTYQDLRWKAGKCFFAVEKGEEFLFLDDGYLTQYGRKNFHFEVMMKRDSESDCIVTLDQYQNFIIKLWEEEIVKRPFPPDGSFEQNGCCPVVTSELLVLGCRGLSELLANEATCDGHCALFRPDTIG